MKALDERLAALPNLEKPRSGFRRRGWKNASRKRVFLFGKSVYLPISLSGWSLSARFTMS